MHLQAPCVPVWVCRPSSRRQQPRRPGSWQHTCWPPPGLYSGSSCSGCACCRTSLRSEHQSKSPSHFAVNLLTQVDQPGVTFTHVSKAETMWTDGRKPRGGEADDLPRAASCSNVEAWQHDAACQTMQRSQARQKLTLHSHHCQRHDADMNRQDLPCHTASHWTWPTRFMGMRTGWWQGCLWWL